VEQVEKQAQAETKDTKDEINSTTNEESKIRSEKTSTPSGPT
jgi:hypothetical protein